MTMRNLSRAGGQHFSSLVLPIALIFVTAGYRAIRPDSPAITPLHDIPVLASWELLHERGVRMGLDDGDVVVTAFIDYQCMPSSRLLSRLDSLNSEYTDELSVALIHYPRPSRPFALPAAIAAECAGEQSTFQSFHAVLSQDPGLASDLTWQEYAVLAGVPDIAQFNECTMLPVDSFPRISESLSLGQSAGVSYTPTVLINGRQLPHTDLRSMRAWVRQAIERAGGN